MNAEEIFLDDEAPHVIPNAQDVHVVAAALGSYGIESDSGSEDEPININVNMTEQEDTSRAISVTLAVNAAEGSVQVLLQPCVGSDMPMEDASSSDYMTSDSEDVEDITSLDELRQVIQESMTETAPQETAGPQPSAAELLFGADDESCCKLNTITVDPQDEIVEAGTVANCIEGTIVVSASAGSQLLGEGSVLVNLTKSIVGRVEDIFGPVDNPMYIIRDPKTLPSSSTEGADIAMVDVGDVVFSMPSLSTSVAEYDLRVKGYDVDDEAAIDEEPVCEFSDDEAVRVAIFFVSLPSSWLFFGRGSSPLTLSVYDYDAGSHVLQEYSRYRGPTEATSTALQATCCTRYWGGSCNPTSRAIRPSLPAKTPRRLRESLYLYIHDEPIVTGNE